LEYCLPIILTYDNLFTNSKDLSVENISQLKDKEILVERDGFVSEYLKSNMANINLVEVSTEVEALKLVSSEVYDYAIGNYYSGTANIKRFGLENVHSASFIIAPREYGFAVGKNDSLLCAQINTAISTFKKDGTYDALYKKWFMYDEDAQKYEEYYKWAAITVLLLGFILVLIFFWNRTLKKEVMNKTKALIEAKAETERLSKIKSEFIAQISHEIRTPINILVSGYEFIKEEISKNEDPEDDSKILLDSIKLATKRLVRTIDLIVNFSELKTGTYKANKTTLDIEKDIIDMLMKEFYVELREKELEIKKIVKTTPRRIEADEYSILQIFSNLLDNAIKFTEEGIIKVVIEEIDNKLCVSIKDTGIGIPEEFIPQLFTPFSQEKQGYTREFDGTGLGLSLAYRYCQLNNAELLVNSKVGVGTVFTVAFNA
ncbi:MAG: transporter substrate-binding domain-containing protein, partial [Melioribacteraceae bacterium]|nr:transporter substrate-binding domain-containing protein [Melioribacteraceae bacterium]